MSKFFNRHMFAIAGLSIAFYACTEKTGSVSPLDSLGIEVSSVENREYSFTDKKSGFWYGTTHQDSVFFGRDGISRKNAFYQTISYMLMEICLTGKMPHVLYFPISWYVLGTLPKKLSRL